MGWADKFEAAKVNGQGLGEVMQAVKIFLQNVSSSKTSRKEGEKNQKTWFK